MDALVDVSEAPGAELCVGVGGGPIISAVPTYLGTARPRSALTHLLLAPEELVEARRVLDGLREREGGRRVNTRGGATSSQEVCALPTTHLGGRAAHG